MRQTEETIQIRAILKAMKVGEKLSFPYNDARHLHSIKQRVYKQKYYHGGLFATLVDKDSNTLVVERIA